MDLTVEKRKVSAKEIAFLNKKYKNLRLYDRVREIYHDFSSAEIMLTSSFAATSAFLLKVIADVNQEQLVHFIDTGYHFKETLKYKEELSRLYGLQVKSISALREEHDFTTADQTWKKNPDFCCHINKVKPLDIIKARYTVWMSGLMEWQSDHRATLDIFEERGEILKFYPLLDISKEERDDFIRQHNLPFHPMVARGYDSIGCSHCTAAGQARKGRWNNKPKTECGLHL